MRTKGIELRTLGESGESRLFSFFISLICHGIIAMRALQCSFTRFCVILFVIFFLDVPVQAQNKKTSEKPTTPRSRHQPIIPGMPSQIPEKVLEGMRGGLQQQLDARSQARASSIKMAAEYLRLAKEASGDERSAILVIAGKHQVDALLLSEADQTFQRVLSESPDSVWAPKASMFLVDLALELHLNCKMAEERLKPGLDWVGRKAPLASRPGSLVFTLSMNEISNERLPLQSLGPKISSLEKSHSSKTAADRTDNSDTMILLRNVLEEMAAEDAIQVTAGDVLLRSGLLAWLRGDIDRAKSEFQSAVGYGTDRDTLTVFANKVRTRPRAEPLPDSVKNGDAEAAMLIRYALILHEAPQTYRAYRMWDALARRTSEKLTLPQRSLVLFNRAQSRFRFHNPLERDATAILSDYAASIKAYPLSDWADDALFLAGNVEYNLNRDSDAAIKLWQRLLRDYPGSRHTERTAYFIGVAYETAHNWPQAKLAFDDAKARYPKSEFNSLIDQHLKKVANELARPKS